MAASEDRRCGYFVQKRGRHCRMLAAKGSTYCGEHLIHDNALVLSESKGSDQLRRRISCPLDSTHTVFEDTLHKHLKKCNAAKKPKPSCYSAHINTGLIDYQPSDEEKLPLSAFSTERIDDLVKKVELAYQEHFIEIKREVLYHPSMEDDLSDPRNGVSALKHLQQQSSILGHLDALGILSAKDVCYIEFGAGRGKLSGCIQKSFKSHSDDPPLMEDRTSPVPPPPPAFEAEIKNVLTKEHEVQAKDLTLDMQQEANGTSTTCEPSNVHYVLVDRDSCRHKVDGTHRVSTLVGAHYHRLLMDIEHLDLRKLECLNDGSNIKQVVAISKHLCGAATDLTLRCIVQTLLQKPSGASQECSSTCSTYCLRGALIALCCHHRCSWPQLVGRSFFERLGFTPVDFHLICHMSSWAVCGVRPPPKSTGGDVVEDAPKSSAEDDKLTMLKKQDELSTGVKNTGHVRWGYVPHPNEEIGLKCKRLIDLARLEFLKEKGLNAWLVYYVDRSTSLENVLLIAMP